MRNISLEIGTVRYSGEFYFMAMVTLNIIKNKEVSQLLLRYQSNKDFSTCIISDQILTGDIQVLIK